MLPQTITRQNSLIKIQNNQYPNSRRIPIQNLPYMYKNYLRGCVLHFRVLFLLPTITDTPACKPKFNHSLQCNNSDSKLQHNNNRRKQIPNNLQPNRPLTLKSIKPRLPNKQLQRWPQLQRICVQWFIRMVWFPYCCLTRFSCDYIIEDVAAVQFRYCESDIQ